MRRRPHPLPRPLATALAVAVGVLALPAAATQRLTVYSGGFEAVSQARGGMSQAGYALVQRPLTVRGGALAIDDLPQALDPSTVQLAGDGVRVRGQRYDFAGLDQAQLLQRAVGSVITVEQSTLSGLREFTGTLVAAGNGLTLREAGGGLRVLSSYSGFTVARPPEGLVARPTLRFDIDAEGQRPATLDYATAGLAWRAEYRADLDGDGRACRMRLAGNALVANRAGVDFEDVALSLVAGDANRRIRDLGSIEVSGTLLRGAPMEAEMAMADAAPAPAPTASGEGYRYPIRGTASLPDGSLQRLPLIDTATDVRCERRYEAVRDDGDWMPERPMLQRDLGGDGEVPVRARLAFGNTRDAGLGTPLPAGRLRAFVEGAFLGEADLGHTGAGRRVELDLGGAFDLGTERRTTAFTLDRAGRTITETVEWTLRNGKGSPATVVVRDRLPRWTDWQLVEGAGTFATKDAQRIEANAEVPANGETKLRYTVRYRWAADITLD